MTAEELRKYVLSLIKAWATNPEVQKSEMAIQVLSDLAGDIQMIPLE